MGAAKLGAVDVDESGLRLHSLAQGDAVSSPGSTGGGAACGGLVTASGDRERPDTVCSRPESLMFVL